MSAIRQPTTFNPSTPSALEPHHLRIHPNPKTP